MFNITPLMLQLVNTGLIEYRVKMCAGEHERKIRVISGIF
jgi:hypothetical protein